jgi:tripeptide aminopeptidase
MLLERQKDSRFPTMTERFVRYAKIHTTSTEGSETYPSTERQFDLARVLVAELKDLGLADAAVDDHCYVTATLPGNLPGGKQVPVIGFIAHMDTYPEVSGEGVEPVFHENYRGGDLKLPREGRVIKAAENPYLQECLGETIITADGTTLLGADDKAGVAEIMEALTLLVENPDFPHGTVKIAFTPDEEVGQGVKHFDIERFGAVVAYTMDGGQRGEIENETFCADTAIVNFNGRDIHPGYAKDKLISSIKVAADFVASLPREMAPETTEGPQGYIHPIAIEGNTSQTKVTLLIRDFDVKQLGPKADLIRNLAQKACQGWPGSDSQVEIKQYYRNMKYDLEKEPRAVGYAMEAMERIGLKAHLGSIRGGTDGANLSARGLPTPNIFTGEQAFHGYTEWVCVKDMELAAQTILATIKVWTEKEDK